MTTIHLYHFVPKDMQGAVLYPLNELKQKHPNSFAEQAAKYNGREAQMEIRVDDLGKWNDVIHMSPIHPKEIMKELHQAGAKTFPWQAFVIDAQSLDQSRLRIMTTSLKEGQVQRHFLPFTEENYATHHTITDRTRQLYRESVSAGEPPLILAGSPHVLYKGSIDTKGLETIEG